ncbi:MAG: class I mannose-6-phosphate isomerase [Abditibacteriota bacterium]|nr:class I mannose-6-phosphate isomerase [Abditibacteriota bacterium]
MKCDYPLLTEPIAVPRVWGAGRVSALYAGRKNMTSDIGECWDMSTWPSDPGDPSLRTVSVIKNGPLAGKPLDTVISLPVVVKIIDSADTLSVQVHPTEEGKTKDEMWYILNATPDAYLFLGVQEGTDPGEYCDLAAGGADTDSVMGLLRRYDDLKPGDYFNVPTGTIHAVGPGIVCFEVSEQTQITYRLFDYNRGRALHQKEGRAAAVSARTDKPVLDVHFDVEADEVRYITRFPLFWVAEFRGSDVRVNSLDYDHIVTAVAGDLTIEGPGDHWRITVPDSMSSLVPAGYPYTIHNTGSRCLVTPFADVSGEYDE